MNDVREKTSRLDIECFAKQMNLVWEDVVFFVNQIEHLFINHNHLKVADIGSCNGDMARFIRKSINKNIYTYNVEILPELNHTARNRDKASGCVANVEYLIGDALNLPFDNDSLDVLIYSRIFHEIFSYKSDVNQNGFSDNSVFHALTEAKRCLKHNGIILIQDPARPDKYDTDVVLSNFRNPKTSLDVTDLLKSDVTTLGTEDLFRRFLVEFAPISGRYTITQDGYIVPKWGASEFIRHRKFNDSQSHWNKEICELYGPLSVLVQSRASC